MKVIKFLFKFFLFIVLILCLGWMILLGALQTRQGQAWVFDQTLHYLEEHTHTHIQVAKMDFIFPFTLRLHGISVFQQDEPLLNMRQLDFSFSYWLLLEGKCVCSALQITDMDVLKIPSSKEKSTAPLLTEPGKAILPFYAKIENVVFKNIHLSPSIIEQFKLPSQFAEKLKDSLFSVKGSLSNHPFKNSVSAHLFVNITDSAKNDPPLQLSLSLEDHQLAVSLHCSHFLLPLSPIQVDTTLALFGTAPLKTWLKALGKSQEEQDAIEGQFKIVLATDDSHPLFAAIGPEITCKGKCAWKGEPIFHLWNTQISGSNSSLAGEASIHFEYRPLAALGQVLIQKSFFEGKIDEIASLSPWLKTDIKGEMSFQAHIEGPLTAPYLTLNLNSPSLDIQEQRLENIQATLSLLAKKESFSGALNLTGHYQQNLSLVNTSFLLDPAALHLSDFQLKALDADLQGYLTYHLSEKAWEGHLKGTLHQLRPFSSFLKIDSIDGQAQATLDFKKQEYRCKLEGQTLHWKQYQAKRFALAIEIDPSLLLSFKLEAQDCLAPQGRVKQILADGHLRNGEGQVNFSLQKMQTASFEIDQVKGDTNVTLSHLSWPFTLQMNGLWKETWAAQTEGTWHLKDDTFQLHLKHLKGSFGSHPIHLLKPLWISHQTEKIETSPFSLQWGEAELTGLFKQERGQISLQFNTNAVSTEFLKPLLADFPIKGQVAISGRLEGTLDKPVGDIQLFLNHLQVTEELFAKKPFIEGEVNLQIKPSDIYLQSTLHGIGHTPIIAQGTLPITMSLFPLKIESHSQTPFSMQLQAEGAIDPYMHLFYDDANLTGQARLKLTISGLMHAPRIQGSLDLEEGTYESLSTGSLYHHIRAHLEGEGTKITLKDFYAENHKKGSLTATGTIELDKQKDFPLEFHLQPKQIFILDSDYATITASGPLRLFGTYKKAKLQGELGIDEAVVHLEEALPKQIKSVEVTYLNTPEGKLQPAYVEASHKKSFVELDIQLRASSQVIIEGKHLSSEWKGVLALTGTPKNPLLHGDLRVVQGNYNLNGKLFNLTQGTIHFAGSPSKKTSLYVVASKEIDRIRADMIVKGPVNKLAVSFRSNPPLSQREILSYILFNRGIAEITPDQGDQLSQSFISLNNQEQSSSNDFLSRLRNNIGLDRLDITSSDSANKDIALQVGKYITEGVFVSINKSISDIGNRVAIEANLRKNLKAQAEVELGGETQGKVSLKWKKDY